MAEISFADIIVAAKAAETPMAPLTLNGQTFDGTTPLELTVEGADTVPACVEEEADRVADGVLACRRPGTVTILLLSDLHYKGDGSMDGHMKKLSRAVSRLRDQIAPDLEVDLGDVVWGASATPYENIPAEARAVNAYLGKSGISLRALGNHDTMYSTEAERYAFSLSHNTPHLTGSGAGGYGYLDLPEAGMRVILLNTSELEDNLYRCAVCTRESQRAWLCGVLADMKGKPEERVLLLAHMPLDFDTTDTGVTLPAILKAYEEGGTVAVGGKTYDFAGERAPILAQLHGHLHNYKTHLIEGTSIPRVSVPNACPSRDNEYSNAAHYPDPDFQERFGGEPTYPKNSGNENFTAFCVAVIDPAEGTVTALRYGAGVNRRVNAAGETVILRRVAVELPPHVYGDIRTPLVADGEDYTLGLVPEEGYVPDTVRVLAGGVDVTPAAYRDGRVQLAAVTADLRITVTERAAVELPEEGDYDNLVPDSFGTDPDGYDYTANGGMRVDRRLSSSGSIKNEETAGAVTSGFIPFTKGQIIRITHDGTQPQSSSVFYCNFYSESGEFKNVFSAATAGSFVTEGSTPVWILDTGALALSDTAAMFRVSTFTDPAGFVITLDQPIGSVGA